MSKRKYRKKYKGSRTKKKGSRTKKKTRITIISNKTPRTNITMKNKVKNTVSNDSSLTHSFSPSINQRILQEKTEYVKNKNVFSCQKDYIPIKKGGSTQTCSHFQNPIVQKIMLENLLSKDKINCRKITAPKQLMANCWFNVFFICFFISDKGRKFFRYLREIMITGKDEKGKEIIDKWAHSIFFHLNLFIEASLQGDNLGKLMDTNIIIRELSTVVRNNFPKVNEEWNPIDFYESIISYLKNDPHQILFIDAETIQDFPHKKNKHIFTRYVTNHNRVPNIIIIFLDDHASSKINSKPLSFKMTSHSSDINYVLDSVIIRDTKQMHFACCLTCNRKEFGFDGESFSKMSPFKWKHNLLNTNKKWKFKSPYSTVFNFKRGLQYLFYYRS